MAVINGRGAGAAGANRWILAAAVLVVAVVGCSKSKTLDDGLGDLKDPDPEVEQPTAGTSGSNGGRRVPSFPQTGINSATVTVTGIVPRSGPFTGGTAAVVRGSGFTADALVRVGGRLVQPRDTRLVNPNSLAVVVPAGDVGPADVTVEVGEESVTREDAYHYNALSLVPTSGSIAGGTAVDITLEGGQFDDRVVVEFGGGLCSQLKVVTPNQVRCKTPSGRVGKVDVVIRWPEVDGVAGEVLEAPDAFEYFDFKDTDAGGLGGGPIEGTLNVTVIDTFAGFVIPNAFVILGEDRNTPYQGRTDARGQITFSGDDLVGPVTIHVAGHCLESASIVSFDAQHVTVHVTPLLDPSCGMPGDPPPPGRGTAGSLISGELIFPGSDEFAVNAWDVIPPPRDNEVRVAYVFTTRARAEIPNPSPAVTGTAARILEETSPIGLRGYPYRIFARPAGLAVYAISGLERRDTGEFIPYIMGVGRDVITAPGDETEDVDIEMNIPLDRELQIELKGLPVGTDHGPDQFRVQANVDLGGEGVIVREVNGQSLDVKTSFTSGGLFRFFAQPALVGTLGDGRYQMIAGWYTGDNNSAPPYTEVRSRGVNQTFEPITVSGFLDVPKPSTPAEGASIPDDRVLRWQMADPAPDMYVVSIIGGNALPAWTQIVPGTQSQTPVPDLSYAEDVQDIAEGVISWTVRAIKVEDFVYDEFKYDYLSSRFWSHTSVDTFTMRR